MCLWGLREHQTVIGQLKYWISFEKSNRCGRLKTTDAAAAESSTSGIQTTHSSILERIGFLRD